MKGIERGSMYCSISIVVLSLSRVYRRSCILCVSSISKFLKQSFNLYYVYIFIN